MTGHTDTTEPVQVDQTDGDRVQAVLGVLDEFRDWLRSEAGDGHGARRAGVQHVLAYFDDTVSAAIRTGIAAVRADNPGPGPLTTDGAGEVQEEGERPVYVETCSPNYFSDAWEAAEAVWDDGRDPTKVTAHPCTVRKAPVPDLVDTIEEAWAAEFDDPGCYEPRIPDAIAAEIMSLTERLLAVAPTVWVPVLAETVTLPDIDCPDCGRPASETWQEWDGSCGFCGRPNPEDQAAFAQGGSEGTRYG